MNAILRFSLIVLLLLCLGVSHLDAQDIHFSQYFNSVLNKNPAQTGIFNGDMRFAANYRHQWYTVKVPYLTFSGAFDKKVYSPDKDNGFWSYGALLNWDRAGDSRMTMAQVALSGSYTFIIDTNHLITGGLQLGGAQRGFDFSEDLTWDSQFQRGMWMPGPSGEPFEEYGKQNFIHFDAGAGINYRWQESERKKIDVGGGLYHIFRPDVSFYDDLDYTADLPMRFTANLRGQFPLGDKFDLMVHGLAQWQGKFAEYVPALVGRFYINTKRGKEFNLDVGAIGRFNEEFDALAPYIGLNKEPWLLAISYDINMSEFKVATDRYGGPEISFIYIIKTVKPLHNFKNCPIF